MVISRNIQNKEIFSGSKRVIDIFAEMLFDEGLNLRCFREAWMNGKSMVT